MSAGTVKQRFEDVDILDRISEKQLHQPRAPRPLPLRQLLACTDCHCMLRILDSFDGRYDDVNMAALNGQQLLEKLRRSRVLDGELILDLVPTLDTVDDSTLRISVRVPPPKPEPKSTNVDYAATLKELTDAVIKYNSARDAECDFVDDHGVDPSGWTGKQSEEHGQICSDIARNRARIQGILRRVTGDETLEF